MIFFKGTKSTFCVIPMNCLSLILYCANAVLHRYVRGGACVSHHKNVDFYKNSFHIVDLPLQDIQAEFYVA